MCGTCSPCLVACFRSSRSFEGAPITAEMLQVKIFRSPGLAIPDRNGLLAPLYGGAALLIREVTVRSGQGWTCTLLLAAAFGLAMQGLIDLAMGGQENPAIPYWSSLRDPTLIPGLGVSVFPTLAWTTGHLMMSVGAPLALVHALAPAHRGRPLLGRLGMPTVLCGPVIGVQVHIDGRRIFDYVPSFGQVVGVLAVITVLAGLALSPLGKATRHVQRSEQVTDALHSPDPPARTVSAALVVTAGATAKLGLIDLLPPTWLGVAILLTVLATMSFALRWCSSTRRWGAEGGRHARSGRDHRRHPDRVPQPAPGRGYRHREDRSGHGSARRGSRGDDPRAPSHSTVGASRPGNRYRTHPLNRRSRAG